MRLLLLLPIIWGSNCIDRIGLTMDIWWLNTLMVFIRFSASSWLPLDELWIDSCLIIGLGELDTLDWLGRSYISFRECLVGLSRLIDDYLFGCDIISWRFHRVHARWGFRTDLSRLNQWVLLLCSLDRLLSLKLTATTLEVLAYVQWWCPKAVSVLTFGSWLLSRATRRLNKLINRLKTITSEVLTSI